MFLLKKQNLGHISGFFGDLGIFGDIFPCRQPSDIQLFSIGMSVMIILQVDDQDGDHDDVQGDPEVEFVNTVTAGGSVKFLSAM